MGKNGEIWGKMVKNPFILKFSGQNQHSLDEKGRFAIPVKYRSHLPEAEGKEIWVLTRGFEKCLLLFTGVVWEYLLEEKLSGLSLGNKQHRIFIRNFISPAEEAQADKQGRIVIPQSLREYAGINRDVFILGANKYIELWDKDVLMAQEAADQDDAMEIVGNKLEEFGI